MSALLADIDATCAALGYFDGEKYLAEPDALQSLKHLIWILRRDTENHEYRRHMGRAQVLQTDLTYMLPDHIDDLEFADVLIRLLIILTNPTLLLYRDGPPSDNHGRKVFMELIDILQGYKQSFNRDAIWAVLFTKLKGVLEIDWALRSEEQTLMIERLLVLIRNVLQVPANPLAEGRVDNDASVHDQVIWALHQSGMLELVLFIISSPDEHQFHLHCLEIICLLYREQTAESLADASLQRSAAEKLRDEQELVMIRNRERARLQARMPPGRHSRFGGTYVLRNCKSVSDRDIICHQPLERVSAIDFDREKKQQKRSFRHVKEEAPAHRRSAYSVRLCLRAYCVDILRSAYNNLVRQVRRLLERNTGSTSHDSSYLLWAIRFFMEFNRLSDSKLELVSESLSVQCFHWTLTCMVHDMDMIVSDKKQARLWAKRLHVALMTFHELLLSMVALQKQTDESARALFDMLLNNVCYVLEYRETILHLLMNYNESHSTKAYLRDVIETANIFIKIMEKFCKDTVVVQEKKRGGRRGKKSKRDQLAKKRQQQQPEPETEEELANKWSAISSDVATLLAGEINLPEEQQPLPFDAASEKPIDEQRGDCMIKINSLLRAESADQAILLLRAAREVWPENDVFGEITAAPEDELLLLREIFMHNITKANVNRAEIEAERSANEDNDADASDEDEDEDEEGEEAEAAARADNRLTEKTFKFDDFAKRLLHPKIVRACTIVLADWQQIATKSLRAAVTILHRIAYGCSCVAMLYQAKLFQIFQQVFRAPRDPHHEELRRLATFVVRKFVETAPTNPKIYAELLFYKSIREANDLESGYCDDYDAGTKGRWTEENEAELRFLFEENQRNPEGEMDVIDWILENLADKTRTRRGVLKKLKELGLMFKAPTKRSNANAAKHLWRPEEDEELRSLYDQYRADENCLQFILNEFGERRNKRQIINRLLALHIIADKSEILPKKQPRKRKPKPNADYSGSEAEELTDGAQIGHAACTRRKKLHKHKPPKKPKARKIVRTPLDVGTVRALIEQVDREQFADAINWLKECLADASEDTEEAAEDDDGVPLLPLTEEQKGAMDDGQFKKVLVALGIQPPITGSETYWRIPVYLNSADLQLRAKIVGGEPIEGNVVDVAGDEGESESESDDADSSADEDAAGSESEVSEEDYLDKQQRERLANSKSFATSRQEQLDELMFNKSDDESESRLPAGLLNVQSVSEERKKRRAAKSAKSKAANPKAETQLFDQLKKNRAGKMKLTELVAEGSESGELDDILNFESEDYRKRLLELSDSDNETTGVDSITKASTAGNKSLSATSSSSTFVGRRPNIIDSDSDESADVTLTDKSAAVAAPPNANRRKRARTAIASDDDDDDDDGKDDDHNGYAGVAGVDKSRHNVNTTDDAAADADDERLTVSGGTGSQTKRRRIAIIDDDDDDDDEN